MSNKSTCSCGGGDGVDHPLGEGRCLRKIVPQHLLPTNFRKENGIDVCTVNGYTITEYTLRFQRLYAQDTDGVWSMPKDEETTISIEMND
jgi:hypothetical protein